MDRQKAVLFFSGAVVWAVLVMAVVVYLFFPYQKALKIALQNVVGGGSAVSIEGVTMRIRASRLLFRPGGSIGQAPPLELSNIDIFWNPLSLIRGKLTIHSKSDLYDGTLRFTIEEVPVMGPSFPTLSLKLEHVNIAKCPEGALPWLKNVSGILDGVVKEETAPGRPDRQMGSFRLTLRGGEVKDIQIRNLPRLIIPYKEIVLEGRIEGARIDVKRMILRSDAISLTGAGTVDTEESGHALDLKLSYEVLSKVLPFHGQGTLSVSGSQAAPVVTISEPGQGTPAGAAEGPPSRGLTKQGG